MSIIQTFRGLAGGFNLRFRVDTRARQFNTPGRPLFVQRATQNGALLSVRQFLLASARGPTAALNAHQYKHVVSIVLFLLAQTYQGVSKENMYQVSGGYDPYGIESSNQCLFRACGNIFRGPAALRVGITQRAILL